MILQKTLLYEPQQSKRGWGEKKTGQMTEERKNSDFQKNIRKYKKIIRIMLYCTFSPSNQNNFLLILLIIICSCTIYTASRINMSMHNTHKSKNMVRRYKMGNNTFHSNL